MDHEPINLAQSFTTSKRWEEVLGRISWWNSERMANANVLVIGAGALGNEVLKNLALLNLRNIFIIDFDVIEYGNLSRSILFREADCGRLKSEVAAERVKEINPHVKVRHFHGDIAFDIGLGLIRRMDVVIACLDNRIARLFINRHCYKVGKTWIDGAIENLSGQLEVFEPYRSCYECQLDEYAMNIIRYRESCTDVAKRNDNFGRIPTTPIIASIIGAMQTQEALKVVYGNHEKLRRGEKYYYDGMNNITMTYPSHSLNDKCISHFTIPKVIEFSELHNQLSVGAALDLIEAYFQSEDVQIVLDYDILFELHGETSKITQDVVLPRFRLSESVLASYSFGPDEKVFISPQKTANKLDRHFPHLHLSLADVGIPKLQVLTVFVDSGIHYVELSGDETSVGFDN